MYETGLIIALAIWLFKIVWAFQHLNSNVNSNLNQIGQRISWVDFKPKPITKEYLKEGLFFKVIKFLVLWIIIPFVFALTSWVYVVYSLGIFLYRRSIDSGKPAEVKEMQWRMRNQSLSFDQVVEIMVKANKMDETKLDEYKESIKNEMRNNGLI
ncbi:hypothetical protein [Acinetobacter higginsii]|uniref:hypothetical protein n=1 Tax=Acinetobacter higginsii TaxID=70347 RepID=UPI0030099E9D